MTLPESTIAERSQEIVDEFALFPDWMGRYEHLIEIGRSLPEIEDEHKTDEYRIKGCQSQVWVRSEHGDGLVYFKGDSDAAITKGLAGLLIRVLNGQPPEAIAEAEFDFLDEIGMKEHLSPTRRNGLSAMVQQMKLKALAQDNGVAN